MRFVLALAALGWSALGQSPSSLRLYVFNCGVLAIPDTSAYQLTKKELANKDMAVACFLISHPKGKLFWDAGAVPDSSFPERGPGKLRYATVGRKLSAQLADIGLKPSDIGYFAISHFHWDHVGNSNLFAGAIWLARKPDWDVMFGTPPSPRTEPQNYSALRNAQTVFLTRDEHDVFGDGTVVLKFTPGHSPGHQVLFLKLAKTGPVVLSGDLYHYPEERTKKRVPTTEADAQKTIDSRADIEAFLKKTGAKLWIQHDLTANRKLKKSPAFYE